MCDKSFWEKGNLKLQKKVKMVFWVWFFMIFFYCITDLKIDHMSYPDLL